MTLAVSSGRRHSRRFQCENGVHAGDDLVAGLAQEQLERLEDGRLDAAVAEAFEVVAEAGFETAQAGVVGRQHVGGAAYALDGGGKGAVAGESHRGAEQV